MRGEIQDRGRRYRIEEGGYRPMCNLTGRVKGLDLRDIYGVTEAADVGVEGRGGGADM